MMQSTELLQMPRLGGCSDTSLLFASCEHCVIQLQLITVNDDDALTG